MITTQIHRGELGTLIRHETTPCSGGWPNLVVREWAVNGISGLTVHCSHYQGFDCKPLSCCGLRQDEKIVPGGFIMSDDDNVLKPWMFDSNLAKVVEHFL